MVSIACSTVADNLTVYFCTSCKCMLKLFENKNSGTVTHYKAASVFVKWL